MSAPAPTTPSARPTPPHPEGRPPSVVFPLLLITAGAVFLLNNLGILPWSIWGQIWRLWPLVLVFIGLELLLGRAARGLLGLVVAVALVVGLVVAGQSGVVLGGRPPSLEFETVERVQSLQGASQASVSVRFGAGRLAIGPLDQPAPDQLARLVFTGPAGVQPASSYRVRGGVGDLDYSLQGRHGGFPLPPFGSGASPEVRLELAPTTPLTLDIETGASTAEVDLSQLNVSRVDLDAGATTTLLRLPERAGLTEVNVDGGASTFTIHVPASVAATIHFDGGLTTIDVDEARFPKVGENTYRSPNYDAAPNKLVLRIDLGAATATVR